MVMDIQFYLFRNVSKLFVVVFLPYFVLIYSIEEQKGTFLLREIRELLVIEFTDVYRH